MKKRNVIIACIAVVVVIGLFVGAALLFGPKGTPGAKHITVEIVAGETTKTVEINTDEEFLRKALEQKIELLGDESAYGLFIKTVDGITADDANQEWWCVTKGGEIVNTGVDTTPIADGDQFELTLTIGW